MSQADANALQEKADRLQRRFLESFIDDILDRYVDPRDEFEGWTPIDGDLSAAWQEPYTLAYRNETDLAALRNQSRQLASQNEFAINALENRVSYIVGTGHVYSVSPQPGVEVPDDLIEAAEDILRQFERRNRWAHRQQEIVLRRDRDGEVFLRKFVGPEGIILRFVEPETVRSPSLASADASIHFGIRYAPGDFERPTQYCITGEWVDAAEVQHRKANVDLADPRGVPTFYPVRKNLIRAAKILRNMSTVAEIQAAIAMVRKHLQGSQATIQQYVNAQADASRTDASGNAGTKTRTYRSYPPGSIIDTTANTDYQFPASTIDVGRFVAGIQAELRAVASRLVMPEFMLSSDASNANYSSTLVAEGPAVKMFDRLQADMIEHDRELLEAELSLAARRGELPMDVLDLIHVEIEPPRVQTRDRLQEVQADQVLVTLKAMSRHTLASRHGLDYEVERDLLEGETDRDAGYYGLPQPPGQFGSNNDGDDNDNDGDNQGGDNGNRDGNPGSGPQS